MEKLSRRIRVLSGFVWLRIGTGGELLATSS
jgi:hypothetical protein